MTANAAPVVADQRRRVRDVAAEAPVAIKLAGLIAVSAAVRFLLALIAPAPWIFPDEWIYSDLSRNLVSSGHFEVWNTDWPSRTFGPLYPIVIAPAYQLTDSIAQAYVLVKALNALAMSCAAVPIYLLARRLVSSRLAFFVVFLSLLVPSMVYTTKVMTENVAYPICLATLLAFVRVLEGPSASRQAVAIAMIGVSFLARAEMLVLVPVYLSAIVLFVALEARSEHGRITAGRFASDLIRYRWTWLACFATGTMLIAAGATVGSSTSVLGAHAGVLRRIRLSALPNWLLYQVAELDLAVGVIPFAAFLLVTVLIVSGRWSAPGHRVYVAVSASAFAWFMVLAAAYDTQPRTLPHVFERYVFYVTPFLFIGLAVWIERGFPRPRAWTRGLALAAALLPLTLPFGTLLNGREWGVSSSTPGLLPWAVLRAALPTDGVVVAAVLVYAGCLSAVFLGWGSRRESRLPLVVSVSLWSVTLIICSANLGVSRLAGSYRNTASPGWVDAAVGRGSDVGAIWAGNRINPNAPYELLEDKFFNQSIRGVYDLRLPMKENIPSQPLALRGRTLVHGGGPQAGKPLVLQYVLTDAAVGIVGSVVARHPGSHLVLYRVGGPVRLSARGAAELHSEGE